jgi:hypothetical protein
MQNVPPSALLAEYALLRMQPRTDAIEALLDAMKAEIDRRWPVGAAIPDQKKAAADLRSTVAQTVAEAHRTMRERARGGRP